MQRPEKKLQSGASLREELVEAMADTVIDIMARLSPVTRLRLLAFMHLFDNPETIGAKLDIEAGVPVLTLMQTVSTVQH